MDYRQFLSLVRNTVKEKFAKEIKFNSLKQKYLGYNYLLKHEFNIEDNIRTFTNKNSSIWIKENELRTFFDEISNKSLPINNCSLWEILICEKPIQWNNKNKISMKYPVLIRLNHCLSDASGLIQLLLNSFADNPNKFNKTNYLNMSSLTQKLQIKYVLIVCFSIGTQNLIRFFFQIKSVLYSLYLLTFKMNKLMIKQMLTKTENFLNYNGNLCGEKIVVWNINNDQDLLKNVKKIKNRLNCTFSDVLFFAISKSLENYYEYVSILNYRY